MIERIIDFSGRNRALVLLLTGAAMLGAWWCLQRVPLDAIPDLSDTQVIVFSRWDRSPDILEDQVTYPIVSALLGAPRVKSIRGFSDFGYSYVYVIFQDGTDLYWARSRVLEYLSKILPRLPEGVRTEIGPGRHQRRLGLPVRPGRPLGRPRSGRAAQPAGLVPALSPPVGARRGGGRGGRRLRQAVPGERRPEPPRRVRRAPVTRWSRPSARATARSAVGCSRSPGPSS